MSQMQYSLVRQIGQGSHSNVYLVLNDETKCFFAIKTILLPTPIDQQSQIIPKYYRNELKILSQCDHPNIIKVIDYFIESKQYLHIVFEFLPINLIEYYKLSAQISHLPIPVTDFMHIGYQILSGLAYLHQKGWMHRDIKPENIMIDPQTKTIKIIDFGMAKAKISSLDTNYVVTRWYRPIEICLGLPYDQSADIFAAGATLVQLILGREIFQSQSGLDHIHKLIEICGNPTCPQQIKKLKELKIEIKDRPEHLLSQYLTGLDKNIRAIVIAMMDNNPRYRLSAATILKQYFGKNQINRPIMTQQKKASKGISITKYCKQQSGKL